MTIYDRKNASGMTLSVEREKYVTRVAVITTLGLRRSQSKNDIRQMADFVNGLVFSGLLLQKEYETGLADISFSEEFAKNAHAYLDIVKDGGFEEELREIGTHEVGLTQQSPAEILVTAGMSAQATFRSVAQNYGIEDREVIDMIILAIMTAVLSQGRDTPEFLDQLIESVTEKTRKWDEMLPSDEDAFGNPED